MNAELAQQMLDLLIAMVIDGSLVDAFQDEAFELIQRAEGRKP